MSDYESLNYAVDGAVANIRLNRPQALNCFDAAMRRELPQAIDRAAAEPSVRVVVLSGEGRGFGAGADLKEGIAKSVTDQLNEEYRLTFDAIENCQRPVISAISGAAAGISLSVALFCDLSVMAEDAFLLSPFTTIALIPDGGLHWLLGRQIGYKRAFEMIAGAERVGAEAALEWGLVNRVVTAARLMDETNGWAASLAERPPLALAAMKRTLREAMHSSFDETFAAEAERQQACLESADCAEGLDAFMNKRKPAFKGA